MIPTRFNPRLQTPVLVICGALTASAPTAQTNDAAAAHWQVVENYCMDCHNAVDWSGGVAFDLMSPEHVAGDAETWEAAIRKLRGGLMPPPGNKRPAQTDVDNLVAWLATSIDAEAVTPAAGRVPLRRLNRREYANSIRDLLGLQVDVAALLPADDIEGGYDNNAAALQVSPAFVDQYLNAARTIAQQAVGDRRPIPNMETYGSVADMIISLPPRGTPGTGTQHRHNEGMPFGTRGGVSVQHMFLADGEYELTIGDLALAREVPNMEFKNTVIALLDGHEFFRTDIGGEEDHKAIDQIQDDAVAWINQRLRGIRFHATAGQHTVTVTFLHRSFAESDERTRETSLAGGQDRIHKIHALQIRGPLAVTGMSETASRARVFVCYPREAAEERPCAQDILQNLAERAFRRPVDETDLRPLMGFYDRSRQRLDFESSVRDALSAILVSPHFIYRAESGPIAADSRLLLTDLELASRLSFFLWSSLPDEALLQLAYDGRLSDVDVLGVQVDRMLRDERARSLIDAFAFQWLNLARLDEISPNGGLFSFASRFLDPRPMFRQELSMFIDSVLRSDQPVTRLLDADYTFINEPLAALYGLEDIRGSRFRKVTLSDSSRHGLLGKGAILMLTANPNRTAPVLRGAWILEHLLGTPPADPPPNVEALPEVRRGEAPKTVRERMEMHSSNPSCNGCHGVMDPLGLALENFNTVGQFRDFDPDTLTPIDASGVLPDGTPINGPDDLRKALLSRTDQFVQTLTENLMTYALGRAVDYRDMPAVRRIVRNAEQDGFRFASIVRQVVTSEAFRMREAQPPVEISAVAAANQTGD